MAAKKSASMFTSKSVSITFACATGLLTLGVWLDTSSRATAENEIAEEAAGTLMSANRPTSNEGMPPATDPIAKQLAVDVANPSASGSADGANGRKIQNR